MAGKNKARGRGALGNMSNRGGSVSDLDFVMKFKLPTGQIK